MPIDEKSLGLASLEELDGGKIGVLLKHHMKRVADDCFARAVDDKARKVTLEFLVSPVQIKDEDTGQIHADTVSIQIKAKSTVPTQQSKPYEMRITQNGLAYNPGSPERYPQQTLDQAFANADDEQ